MMDGHWRSVRGTDGSPQPEWFIADDDGVQAAVPNAAMRAVATLLAVEQVVTVQDAANAVGLTPDDLIAEAEAWAVAREANL